jgi:hypothetical protein
MNEKKIRELVERFLKKTARNVVVPASMTLGISLAGCDSHALHGGVADAGRDGTPPLSDVADTSADAEFDGLSAEPLDAEPEVSFPVCLYIYLSPHAPAPTAQPEAPPAPLPTAKTR